MKSKRENHPQPKEPTIFPLIDNKSCRGIAVFILLCGIITFIAYNLLLNNSGDSTENRRDLFADRIQNDCGISVEVTREQILSMDELPVFGGNYIIDGKRLSAICRVTRGKWVCECTWRD